jgi:hypothetical protein
MIFGYLQAIDWNRLRLIDEASTPFGSMTNIESVLFGQMPASKR